MLRAPAWSHPVAALALAWRWWLQRALQPPLVVQVPWMTVLPYAVSARSQVTWSCATSASSASTWTATCQPFRTCQGARLWDVPGGQGCQIRAVPHS